MRWAIFAQGKEPDYFYWVFATQMFLSNRKPKIFLADITSRLQSIG